MREDTFRRKKASRLFKDIGGRGWLAGRMAEILCEGKRGLDGLSLELGGMVAEAIMYMEREEMAGPDYHPYCSQIQKWASQRGSIFSGALFWENRAEFLPPTIPAAAFGVRVKACPTGLIFAGRPLANRANRRKIGSSVG